MQKIGKLASAMQCASEHFLTYSHRRRHLLRLWLRDPENAWNTPEPLRKRSDRIFDKGLRPGLQVFPLDPVPRSVGEVKK